MTPVTPLVANSLSVTKARTRKVGIDWNGDMTTAQNGYCTAPYTHTYVKQIKMERKKRKSYLYRGVHPPHAKNEALNYKYEYWRLFLASIFILANRDALEVRIPRLSIVSDRLLTFWRNSGKFRKFIALFVVY